MREEQEDEEPGYYGRGARRRLQQMRRRLPALETTRCFTRVALRYGVYGATISMSVIGMLRQRLLGSIVNSTAFIDLPVSPT
jgi:hypothetical protein